MKPKNILTSAIALLCLSQMASADLTLHITGSSAFRAAVVNAIKNKMTFTNAGEGFGYDGTNFTKGTYHIFKGQFPSVAGSGTVTIKTNWSGSVEGIRDVAGITPINYIASTDTVTSAGTTNMSPSVTEVPEIAYADNKQTSTIYKSPNLAVKNTVGIVPFAIVASKSAPSSLYNNNVGITAQLVDGLLTEGRLPISIWTGDLADTTKFVYVTGRSPGSGTRLTTLAETKHGTLVNVHQIRPTGGTIPANAQVTDIEYFPINNPDVPDLGNDGYTSGGGVADFLRCDTSAAVTDRRDVVNPVVLGAGTMSFVGYVGESDSYGAVFGAPFQTTPAGANAGNAHYLTYNGIKAFDGVAKKPGSSLAAIDQPTWTSGSALIQLANTGAANDETGFVIGQIVSGTGIAPGSTILSISTPASGLHQITLDKNTVAPPPALASTNLQVGALIPSVIRNGKYTFWNYEYALWRNGTGNGLITSGSFTESVANAIVTEVTTNTYSLSGLALDTAFKVQRGSDGGYVYPNGN